MSKTAIALAFAALSTVAACSNPFRSDDGTRIRLRNSSAFELTNVTFMPGAAKVEFARIAPGAATEYRRVESA